jgi:polysaccharide chain length determinant protein (PEP-CTERM system associated)
MDTTHMHSLDYLAVVRRRRWYLIVPIAAGLVVGLALVRFLPRTYRSATTLGVTAASVSPHLVTGASPFDDQERLRAISQQLLSPQILSRVAREEGMAAPDGVDRQVDALRRSISVSVPDPVAATNAPRSLDAFVVTYTDSEPVRTQRIASRLASVFVDENSKVRAEHAEDTTAFIAAQASASAARLAALEERLRRVKEAHMGELPEQSSGNLQAIAGLRQQMGEAASALDNERDRISAIDRQLDAYKREGADAGETGVSAASSPAGRVKSLEHDLAAAQSVYTDKHPEVQRLKEELASARRDAAAAAQQPQADRLAELQRNPAYVRLLADRDAEEARIKTLERSRADAEHGIRTYQSRVDASPMVEQELSSIERDYNLEKQQYADLSAKQSAAAMAANVVRDRGDERFTVLVPASRPAQPVTPVPARVMLMALAAGLVLGAALALGREFLDGSIHDERQLRDELELPTLGSVSRIPV